MHASQTTLTFVALDCAVLLACKPWNVIYTFSYVYALHGLYVDNINAFPYYSYYCTYVCIG